MWLKGTAIEITEEMIDQIAKNVVDIANGEEKSMFEDMDEDFFANVIAFSFIVNGLGGGKAMFQMIQQGLTTPSALI